MPLLRSPTLSVLLSVCLVTAVLYLGKPFLSPLALSILLAFLLAPLAGRLESAGCGRILSVIIVTVVAFTVLASALYVVGAQAVDLAKSLPQYHDNLQQKVFAPLGKLTSAFSAYSREMHSDAQPEAAGETASLGAATSNVNLLAVAKELAGPLLAPLGTGAVVVIYVIFFLFDRQNLRDRFIHLVGNGRLHLATQALDDAASRVSRYLAAQLLVNACYGIPVGIGLHFIGIPNAPLWGLLAIVLRFLPYLGIWIAAAFPIVLSFAISPGWAQPIETVALFMGMELITANVIEPWLYGASTGISSSAIVVSAVFWTWVWGAGGLLLATPMTVCLVVLGKHVSALSFLNTLFGDQPAIAPQNRFYQRLLADDRDELEDMMEEYQRRDATLELFDDVILPALQLAEHDRATDNLSKEEHKELYVHLREILGATEGFHAADASALHSVVIVPARTDGDALAGAMLAYLLRSKGIDCTWFSERILNSEIVSRLADQTEVVLCVSALTLTSARAASSIFKRIGGTMSGQRLLGLWRGDRADAAATQSQPDVEIIMNFADALRLISATTRGVAPTSIPKDVIISGAPIRPLA
ncbi:MAG: AI-2E family transporter [Chthoniobacter sp.]|uniref:AI-2E family transporter n=1 Tax=Chthoniobacter sp. TaxID=2510640 RepID=UPI0032A93CC7